MRLKGRTDSNQKEIVMALRQVGASVVSLAGVGSGCPDLLVATSRSGNLLFEVKDGSKKQSARRLTEDEQNFHALWRGPIYIVESVEDALKIIGAVK